MTKADQQFLFQLLETPSPTGFEMPGQRVWAAALESVSDETACDAYGSTWARLKGKSSSRTVMLEAHADEIGYMVKHISKEGFLRVDRVGGSDAATGRGRRVWIQGDQGPVAGILGNTAIHLRRDSLASEKAPQVHELWIDVGASTAEEVAEMGIRVGHPLVYQDGPMSLGEDKIVSRALDNRVGGYIIAQVMKRVAKAKKKPALSLLCLNAVQEEIGGYGAKMASHRLMPDVCLCLDVTHATDTPGIDDNKYGKVTLGGGPALCHGTANHPLVVKKLMEVAEKEKISIQHEASSRYTGTDTDSIYHVKEGIPSALVSLPLRCMHSVVETVSKKDVEQTICLLTAFVMSLSEDEEFGHQL